MPKEKKKKENKQIVEIHIYIHQEPREIERSITIGDFPNGTYVGDNTTEFRTC